MTELNALYQKNILDLAKIGRASRRLDHPEFSTLVKNPTCGDQVRIDISFLDGQTMIGAKVKGCALCEAATGLIICNAENISMKEANRLFDDVSEWLHDGAIQVDLNQLDSFAPVKEIQARIGCVLLPFQALAKCTENSD